MELLTHDLSETDCLSSASSNGLMLGQTVKQETKSFSNIEQKP